MSSPLRTCGKAERVQKKAWTLLVPFLPFWRCFFGNQNRALGFGVWGAIPNKPPPRRLCQASDRPERLRSFFASEAPHGRRGAVRGFASLEGLSTGTGVDCVSLICPDLSWLFVFEKTKDGCREDESERAGGGTWHPLPWFPIR